LTFDLFKHKLETETEGAQATAKQYYLTARIYN